MSVVRPSLRDIVCLSHLRWDFVWQRPQQLLSRSAREARVFFVEEAVPSDGPSQLDVGRRDDGVHVVVPRLASRDEPVATQRRLLSELLLTYEIADPVLWYYTPMALAFTRELRAAAVVYDCMDELSAFAGAPPELLELEAELLERADVVFTGGRSLWEAKRDRHSNVHLFPSSVDVAHFAQARGPQEEHADQDGIERPRLGFYGVIDERMNLDLLARVSDARPDWQILLVGPVVKIGEDSLPSRPNLHLLGQKSYDELPRLISGWDVALLPFALNEATRFISPTKTPEYLAAGLPVVSTPIHDVLPYGDAGLVHIAATVEEFVAAVERALGERDSAERLRRVDAALTESSWDYTWADMRELVATAVRVKEAARRRSAGAPRSFDWLVVGAGFAGSVLAERLASQLDQRVLVVDRRFHIGGNAYDHYDDAGVLVHRYGPHIFHTNSRDVFDYLGQFTPWRPYEHRVLASVDGRLVPFPINLDTVNQLYGLGLNALELDAFFESVAEPRSPVRTSEDVVLSKVGHDLYVKFFRGYTRKQWDLDPSELDASVTARVPTRLNRDDRYFTDTYQAMPLHGYTRMFERMLDHPNISILLGTDYRDVERSIPYERMVYTGPVDEFFDLRYGKLPYRSLEFRFETYDRAVYQSAPVVNYPNDHAYTRTTEFKYLTGQEHAKTTIVSEYPRAEGDPYYPVPRPENRELYEHYKALADERADTVFVGRLATYRYYNMDQVVAQALATFRRLETGGQGLVDADAPPARAAVEPAEPARNGRPDPRAVGLRRERA